MRPKRKLLRNLNDSIKNLLIISKIFALLPIRRRKNSEKFTPCVYSLIYNVALAITSFFGFLYLTENNNYDDENTISEASGWLDLYMGTIIQTTGILLNCLNAKKIVVFFNKIDRIDRQFNLLSKHVDYQELYNFVNLAIGVVLVELCIIFVPEYFLIVENETVLYLLCSYCPILTTGIVKVQFAVFVFLIFQRFCYAEVVLEETERLLGGTTLSTFLPKTAKNHVTATVDVVHEIQNELYNLCDLTNRLYGCQNFLMVLSTFSVCITQFYFCYSEGLQLQSGFALAYFSMQWAVLQLLEVFSLTYLCESVHLKMDGTKHIINRLLFKSKDQKLNVVLKTFSMHEMHRDVRFSCGLFSFDFGMIQMLCGMISSYLIIMIQLDIARSETGVNQTTDT